MEKHAFHVWRYGAPLLVLAAGAAALAVPPSVDGGGHRRLSPRQTVSGGVVPGGAVRPQEPLRLLSHVRPHGGGGLFPSPGAGGEPRGTGVAQTIPFFLGRREQGDWRPWRSGFPGGGRLPGPGGETRGCPSFCCGWRGHRRGRGEPLSRGLRHALRHVSLPLAAGRPARIACATVLGGALWQRGSGRFWLSLAAGGALTALSRRYLAPVAAPQEGVKRRLLFFCQTVYTVVGKLGSVQ